MSKKKTPKTERLEPITIRVRPDQMLMAKEYKLNVPEICRNAIYNEIAKRENKCPTCGTKSKQEKK